MTALISLYSRLAERLEYQLGPVVMPTLARFVFAAVFLMYYWNSAVTKLGGSIEGLYKPSFNAFAQIFPKGAEAASYDIGQASTFQQITILAGTWAEFVLPVLLVVGLFTRFAAIGMVGFVVVQTATDLIGHNALNDAKTLGAWFDGTIDSAIMDQRALAIMLILILVFRGAGPLSLDGLIRKRLS